VNLIRFLLKNSKIIDRSQKIYVGIDIEKISKIKRLLKSSESSLEKIFTKNELKLTTLQIAGNFAAKEATIKAFSPIKKLHFNQIEILRDLKGRPFINILCSELATEKFSIDVSISNTEEIVIATLILKEI